MAMSRDLPGDIMIDILSGLPVKSLMRFRCVCKSWCSLVSNPTFITMHFNQTSKSSTSNSTHLIIERRDDILGENQTLHCQGTFLEGKETEILFNTFSGNFVLVDSCNGLLCLIGPRNSKHLRNIYLWNPSIRKYKILPNCQIEYPLYMSTPHVVLGFGFLPQINDYKVVKMVYYKDNLGLSKDPPQVEIYSLSTNSWRKIEDNVQFCHIPINSSHAFVNGAVHWLASIVIEKRRYKEFILSFDMTNEVFQEIKLPKSHDGALRGGVASVFKESLLLHIYCSDNVNECWDIWVMKEYGVVESWTKQFTIEPWVRVFYPFSFMKNGEVVLQNDDGDLVLYDPEVQQVQDLRFYGDVDSLDVFTYMGSLILLNEGDEVAGNQIFPME